jgi:hypothetical protein
MTSKQRSALRSPNALADAWEKRTELVRRELAAASAANDAKTARLRALRLEKEKQEAAIKKTEEPAAGGPRPRRAKRIVSS